MTIVITPLKKSGGGTIDLAVIDPPYEIHAGNGGGIYADGNKDYIFQLQGIDKGFDYEILDELIRVQKKINMYIWCSLKQVKSLFKYFENKNVYYNILCWHKTNPIPACCNKYLTDTEYLLYFREKGVKINGNYKTKFTYYVTPLNVEDKKKWEHPTIKPLFIIENLIINSSLEGQTVLDCFMGSGTTGVACKKLNRNFIGIEIDERYFNIAKQRIGEANIETVDKVEEVEEPKGQLTFF